LNGGALEEAGTVYRLFEGSVVLESRVERLAAWAYSYLAPYFSVSTGEPAPAGTWTVRVSRAAPRGTLPTAGVDCWRVVGLYVGEHGYRRELANGAFEIRASSGPVWKVDPRNGQVLLEAAEETEALLLTAVRVTRDILAKLAEDRGAVVLHGGATLAGGRGVVACGPKMAGKTTLLLSLVEWLGGSYVANDKLFVRPARRGFEAVGWPTTCSVAVGTLSALPSLAPILEGRADLGYPQAPLSLGDVKGYSIDRLWRLDEKAELLPSEVARFMGCRVTPAITVDAVLMPELEPVRRAARILPLDAAEARRRLEIVDL